MIDGIKPYHATRESGIAWLGELPEHWSLSPAKRSLCPEPSGPSIIKNVASSESKRGYVPAFSASGQDVWLPTASHRGGALVLSAVGARCGRTFKASGDWAVVANTQVLRPNENQSRDFWWYVTNSPGWWERAGAAQPFVRVSSTLDRTWAIPPLSEQTAIVRFLDHADRRIRRYIRAKDKLIALLEEQKQSIIHQAVTGRIDVRTGQPYPAYKPSGVEWLGVVPEHWELKAAKWYFREVDNRSKLGMEELLSVSHITGVTPRSEKNVTMFKAESNVGYKMCQSGDVVVNTMWAWMAALGVARQAGIVSPSYAVYRPQHSFDLLSDYADLLLRTTAYRSEYRRRSTGIRSSRLRLYPEEFLRIIMLCPPPEEQRHIVEYVTNESKGQRRSIDLVHRKIDLLREYRTRLIADVVTGKLDVREAAAALPEVDPFAVDEEAEELLDAKREAAFNDDQKPAEVVG